MNEDEDRFSEDERITANLRLRSVSPTGRTLLGFFAFIPPAWRGPVAIIFGAIGGFLLSKVPVGSIIAWAKGH